MISSLDGRSLVNEPLRSFIAFDISSPQVLRNISNVQRALITTGADLKIVEPQNIHVTLKFLGDISLTHVDSIHNIMKSIPIKTFDIELRGLGVFPSFSKINIVWIGVTRGRDELAKVAESLEGGLKALGFPKEERDFNCHLTIMRLKSSRNKEALVSEVEKFSDFEFGVVKANSLRLKKSVLTSQGPTYSTLREVDL